MTKSDRFKKRTFDFIFSLLGLVLTTPIIILGWVLATISTRKNGFFFQVRIGRNCRPFKIVKLRTMMDIPGGHVTSIDDHRITPTGKILRKWKIDELPQLWNILVGDMSFVGPRPDVPGYLDKLQGQDADIATLRPGITGPATLKYRNEEEILSKVENQQDYNDSVIWPDKVRINKKYLENWSFHKDIAYIKRTFFR